MTKKERIKERKKERTVNGMTKKERKKERKNN